ncbi:MAG TPA: hypothetical protein VFY44_07940 [Thermoleophilaceae bacterium]|nr:hypothetical protein [Thermoleophilaceae bacterium]
MRRLTLPLALLAVLAMAASALAATNAAKFDMGFTTKKPAKSTAFSFDVAFANTGGNQVPAALNKFSIALPAGTKFNGDGAAKCTAAETELDTKFSAACPSASIVGSGKATAVPSGGGNSINTTVKIANQGKGSFRFFFALNGKDVTGFTAKAKGSKLTSETLTGSLPGGVIVTSLKGSIKKKSAKGKNLITTPKSCPKSKKWKFSGTFNFADGTHKVSDSVSCKS